MLGYPHRPDDGVTNLTSDRLTAGSRGEGTLKRIEILSRTHMPSVARFLLIVRAGVPAAGLRRPVWTVPCPRHACHWTVPMTSSESNLVILFADIAQSTRLYEILGDEAAQTLIGACLSRLKDTALRHRGRVVKTIGDEVMCTFPDAGEAVAAAKDMHLALEERFSAGEGPGISPNLHVGLHVGPVIREEEDVFGDAVNVAARLVKMAKSRQILTSETVVGALKDGQKESMRSLGCIPVKGKHQEMRIFELIWEDYDMTIIADQALVRPDAAVSMELRLGDQVLRVGPGRPSVTLGRDKDNDLRIPGTHVSRSHARVELLAGTFLLSDQSSNGTYISFQNGETIHLRRDKVVLYGSGTISPGLRSEPAAPGIVRFREIP